MQWCCVRRVTDTASSSQHISFSEHVSVISNDQQRRSSTSAAAAAAASDDDLSYIDDEHSQNDDLLLVTSLKRWDYPVFDLCDRYPDTLLSRVSLRHLSSCLAFHLYFALL